MSETASRPAKHSTLWKVLKVFCLILIMAFLWITVSPFFSDSGTYPNCISYLDSKLSNAKMLTLGATSASFVVSLIPDDAGTPIANELARFSGYLLFVISAIFLERYLLTTIGFVSTAIILPMACLFAAMAALAREGNKTKFKEYAFRLLIFGVCIVLIIPLGCTCGHEIERANEESIENALEDARNANTIVESIPDENRNVFEKVGDFFTSLWGSATKAYEWAKTVLSNYMSSVAVMLVTTIAIPILMLFCFLWLVKFLTKRDFVIAVVGYADRMAESTRQRLTPKKRNLPRETDRP